jgi:hypothetical protein
VTKPTVIELAAMLAAAALAWTGCGGSGDESSGRPQPAPSGVGLLARANTACLQARADASARNPAQPTAPASTPWRQARRLRSYARRNLPVATRTLAVLRRLRPADHDRQALARLEGEYERLFALYLDAAAPRRQSAKDLAEAVGMAEANVRAQAHAARLPACSP